MTFEEQLALMTPRYESIKTKNRTHRFPLAITAFLLGALTTYIVMQPAAPITAEPAPQIQFVLQDDALQKANRIGDALLLAHARPIPPVDVQPILRPLTSLRNNETFLP